MKRTKFLALTLVVAIMLMGAGYAFWSEALAIDGTVNTGELNFAFVDESFTPGPYVGGKVETNNEGHGLDIELKNMHPGSTAEVKFCLENTGTIGIKFEDFVVEGDNPNLDQLLVKSGSTYISVEEYFKGLEDIVLEPGEKECRTVEFYVRKCATEENFEELTDFEFGVEGKVKQYNDDGSCETVTEPEPEPEPEPEKCPHGKDKDRCGQCNPTKPSCGHKSKQRHCNPCRDWNW